MFFISHWGNALADQLLQRFNVERGRDELFLAAHLQEGAHFHLSVLLFNVALAQHDPVTVHVLVDVHLEKLFELRHVCQVDLDGLLRQDIDCVLTHLW